MEKSKLHTYLDIIGRLVLHQGLTLAKNSKWLIVANDTASCQKFGSISNVSCNAHFNIGQGYCIPFTIWPLTYPGQNVQSLNSKIMISNTENLKKIAFSGWNW